MLVANKNIIEYLEYWAEHNGQKPALKDEKITLTYMQTLQRVSVVAKCLVAKGLSAKPVIVRAERCVGAIIAFLGVAMSTNYYVPVDYEIPDDKLGMIIESSGAEFMIVVRDGCDSMQLLEICGNDKCEIHGDAIADQAEVLRYRENYDLNSRLCLIYTSGSTGIPKGVIKTHKNFASFIDSFIQTFGMDSSEVIANQTPFSFDASAKDIYLSLAAGATLCIPPKQLFSFPTRLIEFLNENKVSFICWVPSALTVIARLRALKFVKPQYLKRVFFVGEVFVPKYLNSFLNELQDVKFYNLYGSTELAGVCLYYAVEGLVDDKTCVPLGKPLANNVVFLSDEAGNRRLDSGEICVISEQTAIGYVNDEQKNREVFVQEENVRILRTGDFATYDKNKNLVFLSRKDFQIKHMGYRIELQEIELAVTALEYIDSCCCIYENQRIIAVIVLADKDSTAKEVAATASTGTMQKRILDDLKQKLPSYMLPNKLMFIDKMPLNSNGKTDRVNLKNSLREMI